MSADDLEFEPVPGLPSELPPGETMLWQGRPDWKSLARHTFKVRMLAAYFAVFATFRLVTAIQSHQGLAGFGQVLVLSALAAGCLGVVSLMAWGYARATVYTITSHRLVMRIGIALPMTWNIPFKRIASADLTVRKDGRGDISLQLTSPNRIAWLHLWPHVAPWQYVKARPTFRTIAEPARVAEILGDAVHAWSSKKTHHAEPATEPAPETVGALRTPDYAPELPIAVNIPQPALAREALLRQAPSST